jgi:addiction module RelE/StbE family toxin
MMVRWTGEALRDLESLHSHIFEDNPDAAADTVGRIVSGIEALGRHPEMGRKGRVPGTRELVIAPYIVAYRIRRSAVEINAIIHSARRWPSSL